MHHDWPSMGWGEKGRPPRPKRKLGKVGVGNFFQKLTNYGREKIEPGGLRSKINCLGRVLLKPPM